jgi:hypothetical protein
MLQLYLIKIQDDGIDLSEDSKGSPREVYNILADFLVKRVQPY